MLVHRCCSTDFAAQQSTRNPAALQMNPVLHTHSAFRSLVDRRSPPARASPRLLRPARARLPPRQDLLPRAQAPARPAGVLQHVRVPLHQLLAVAHADKRAAAALQQAVQRGLGRRVQRARRLRALRRCRPTVTARRAGPACKAQHVWECVGGSAAATAASERPPPGNWGAAAAARCLSGGAARARSQPRGHRLRRAAAAARACFRKTLGARAPRPGRRARGGAGGGAGTRCAAARPGSARAPTPAPRPGRPRAGPALRAAPRRRSRGLAGQAARRRSFARRQPGRHGCAASLQAHASRAAHFMVSFMYVSPGSRTSSRRASSSSSLQPRSSALPSAAASAPQQPGSSQGGRCCAAMQRQLAAAAESCTNPGRGHPLLLERRLPPCRLRVPSVPSSAGPQRMPRSPPTCSTTPGVRAGRGAGTVGAERPAASGRDSAPLLPLQTAGSWRRTGRRTAPREQQTLAHGRAPEGAAARGHAPSGPQGYCGAGTDTGTGRPEARRVRSRAGRPTCREEQLLPQRAQRHEGLLREEEHAARGRRRHAPAAARPQACRGAPAPARSAPAAHERLRAPGAGAQPAGQRATHVTRHTSAQNA
jgi:hypothetical protein